MNRRPAPSIRGRTVRLVAGAVLGVSALGSVVLYALVSRTMIRQFDETLQARAEAIGALLQYDGGVLELDARDEALAEYRGKHRRSFYEVLTPTGSHALTGGEPIRTIAPPAMLADISNTSRSAPRSPRLVAWADLPNGELGRALALRVIPGVDKESSPQTRPISPVWVVVASDTDPLEHALLWLAVTLVGTFGGTALAGALLLPRLIRSGLAPLEGFSQKAAAINPQSIEVSFFSQDLPEELRPIAERLDQSMRGLAAAFGRERRFAGDAAHELRTPLAAVRANAEVALRWPDEKHLKESMVDVLSAATRMQTLVERLLELSRLGAGMVPHRQERVDLTAMLGEIVLEHLHQMTERKLNLKQDIATSVTVASDAELLGMLLDNLISNAASHALPGTEVSVSLRETEGCAELEISNDSDLTPEDLSHMFQPLWKKAPHRSVGGAGLGLALVSEYARVMRVTFTPSITPLGRFTIRLTLPLFRKSGQGD